LVRSLFKSRSQSASTNNTSATQTEDTSNISAQIEDQIRYITLHFLFLFSFNF
jgi:hypothetical protein